MIRKSVNWSLTILPFISKADEKPQIPVTVNSSDTGFDEAMDICDGKNNSTLHKVNGLNPGVSVVCLVWLFRWVKRTVEQVCDWRFDNFSGSHLQSQVKR